MSYANHRGGGVTKVEHTPLGIKVHFGGKCYHYNHDSCGRDAVAEMKRLAQNGQGLAAYIRQHRPQHEEE